MDLITSKEFWLAVLGSIVAIDTALSYIPAIKANSAFQLVNGTVMKIIGFLTGK